MAVPRLTDDLDVIQKLSDNPNDTDGLSAAKLKARFDAAVNIIKLFLNGSLAAALDEIETNALKLDGKEITNVLGIDNSTIPTSAAVRASLSSSGAGDMAAATYDVDGKREDIFRYADEGVSNHNGSGESHGDIRVLIQDLSKRINAVLDSDDETLDELSEIVAYIKSNRDLLEAVTTAKVSVIDIINNLTTNVSSKPLSAAQGVALKALIDEIPKNLTATDVGAFAAYPPKTVTNADSVYDAGVYLISGGTNTPTQYGVLVCYAYRKLTGNTKPDYATQLFFPTGDHPDTGVFVRTSTASSWNSWNKCLTRVLDSSMYGEEGTEPSNPVNGQLYITLL